MKPNLKMACDAIEDELTRIEQDDHETQQELYNIFRSSLDTLTGNDRDQQRLMENEYLSLGKTE